MVTLLSKSEILALNIDSVERAIIFACTILRASIVGLDSSQNKLTDVRISQNIVKDDNFIVIEVSIPYDSFSFNKFGGNVLKFIQTIPTASTAIETIDYRLSVSPQAIPTLPNYDESYIDSFEAFLVYYCFILQATLGGKNDNIDIQILDENPTGSIIKIKGKFSFNYSNWLLGSNLVETVNRIVLDAYNDTRKDLFILGDSQGTESENTNVLDNSLLLDNNILLSN